MQTLVKMMSRNLRYYSRVPSAFDIRFFTKANTTIDAKIQNISRAGLMVEVNHATLNQLIPNIPIVSPKHPIMIIAEFSLDKEMQSPLIHVNCDVMYARRLSRDLFQLGMSFRSLKKKDAEALNSFIDTEQHSA
jgi:hypothetical protein